MLEAALTRPLPATERQHVRVPASGGNLAMSFQRMQLNVLVHSSPF
jgi:hypothetical protein